jgi:hypothetical protein
MQTVQRSPALTPGSVDDRVAWDGGGPAGAAGAAHPASTALVCARQPSTRVYSGAASLQRVADALTGRRSVCTVRRTPAGRLPRSRRRSTIRTSRRERSNCRTSLLTRRNVCFGGKARKLSRATGRMAVPARCVTVPSSTGGTLVEDALCCCCLDLECSARPCAGERGGAEGTAEGGRQIARGLDHSDVSPMARAHAPPARAKTVRRQRPGGGAGARHHGSILHAASATTGDEPRRRGRIVCAASSWRNDGAPPHGWKRGAC